MDLSILSLLKRPWNPPCGFVLLIPDKHAKKSARFSLGVFWQPGILQMSRVSISIRGRNGENNRLAAGATPPPPSTLASPCSLFAVRANPPFLSLLAPATQARWSLPLAKSCWPYSRTGCSFQRNFANFRRPWCFDWKFALSNLQRAGDQLVHGGCRFARVDFSADFSSNWKFCPECCSVDHLVHANNNWCRPERG